MKRARGFSLIEVVLAITLMAAGMALAFGTLRNSAATGERAEVAARNAERLRAVQALLRRQIVGALPQPITIDESTGESTLFELERDRLSLIASMPGYLSRGGPYLQTFRLVRADDGMQLQFVHELMTPDGPVPDERPPEVLLSGIAEARFEVRTLLEDGRPGPWQAEWKRFGQMPMQVRLRLRFEDGVRRWPELVAAPRLAGSYGPTVSIPGAPGGSGGDTSK